MHDVLQWSWDGMIPQPCWDIEEQGFECRRLLMLGILGVGQFNEILEAFMLHHATVPAVSRIGGCWPAQLFSGSVTESLPADCEAPARSPELIVDGVASADQHAPPPGLGVVLKGRLHRPRATAYMAYRGEGPLPGVCAGCAGTWGSTAARGHRHTTAVRREEK